MKIKLTNCNTKLFFRFLATGNSYSSLAPSFRIGISTLSQIIPDTCKAIWDTLQPEYLRTPSTPSEWRRIANDFDANWQFPNCLGAIDGKHITIEAPPNTGSQFFNYKKTFSLVLLALVDANYNFTYVDIGSYGKQSDGAVFANSSLGKSLQFGDLGIPSDQIPQDGSRMLSYCIVGDEAFPLKKYLMRPFPGKFLSMDKRIFNYRLSRARRIVENAFGILAAKWRIFRRPMALKIDTADKVVQAACCLHNFVRSREGIARGQLDHENNDGIVEPGNWRQNEIGWSNLARRGNNSTREAMEMREQFKQYFNEEGRVPWQNRIGLL